MWSLYFQNMSKDKHSEMTSFAGYLDPWRWCGTAAGVDK